MSNGAGNFYSLQSVTPPLSAKVTYGGAVRQMTAAATSGDCNTCHTQNGANGAPGRIKTP
jgi:mono/diheme cytochrome c family protein